MAALTMLENIISNGSPLNEVVGYIIGILFLTLILFIRKLL